MNGILILNGVLLLAILGFQQWCGAHRLIEDFRLFEGVGLAYSAVSLTIPLIVFIKGKTEKISRKREIIALLIFNPLMFCVIPHRYQQINYQWSISKIVGPQLIQTWKTDEPVFVGGFFPILEVPTAVTELYHRHIAKDE
jgi:hypothetical protein